MSRDRSGVPQGRRAALYLAGALDAAETAAFEASAGTAAEELARLAPVADALARAIPEVPPSPEVRRRLMERIASEAPALPPSPQWVALAADERWVSTPVAGVSVRVLRPRDPTGRMVGLVRLEPGAILPPHHHAHDEEIFLLEGDYEDDGRTFHAGDYLYTPAGTGHDASRSVTGCVALVIASFAVLLPA